MKVNTDGVLLGALATAELPETILDIGTGTGVIALMLAQRFPAAKVDAVEIDRQAAGTAAVNFGRSPFSERCNCYPGSFKDYHVDYPEKRYDLIVSNPPFFINSLKSADKSKEVARHTTIDFFSGLFSYAAESLNTNGRFWLILPPDTAVAIKGIAENHSLFPGQEIEIASFAVSKPHRKVICFEKEKIETSAGRLEIYSSIGVYSDQYALLLKDFLTIF